MCLVIFSYDQHPEYKLILAANRDEFLDRPTVPAAFWDEHPGLLAGKDAKAGGTWMGITRNLRFAAITNFRDLASLKEGAPSRGHLVSEYLKTDIDPESYLEGLKQDAASYNGFNLLVGNADGLWYFSNREGMIRRIESGVHGLSNHLLNTPWPKVEEGKTGLHNLILSQQVSAGELISLLKNNRQAPDEHLPQTGVSLDWERRLSAMFICTPHYGTRASSALLIDRKGNVTFVEQTNTLDPARSNESSSQVTYSFLGHKQST